MLKQDLIFLPLPTRRWLTPDESAAYLGISRRQFDAVVAAGGVDPSRSAGDRLPRFEVDDLDEMMREGKHGLDRDAQG